MTDHISIHFLGTGAAVPSVRRGLPSLAIDHETGIILCDMGEATQMAIHRAGLSPSKIHTIMISHLHGDHIFGLPGFITSQQMMDRSNPLTLIGPPGLQAFIESIKKTANFDTQYPLYIRELPEADSSPIQVGPFTVTTLPLDHRTLCYGYRFVEAPKPGRLDAEKAEQLGVPHGPLRKELKLGNPVTVNGKTIHPDELVGPEQPGRTIAYCTDTRPCDNAINLAQNADVLVHDSTFSHTMTERAHLTFHSTSVQAAEIAKHANVNTLFLWHLSIRNNETDEAQMLNDARTIFPNTRLSHDYLHYPVARKNQTSL